jgi:hypothetical protein
VQQASRFDLARALAPRYAHASRREKGQLLDEFCALTGYTRKHALVVLSCPPPVRHELTVRGVTQLCLLDDFLSEAALGQVSNGRRIDEQAIPVQLGRGTQYRCSRWVMLNCCARASSALSLVASEIAC